MSGFIPRHIEQPASRHSKPAERKTSCSPSASAVALTCWEPGTTIARTEPATLRPSTISAASRRSSIRELVQEPMKTRSGATSVIGVPALEAHVGEGAFGRLAVGGRVHRRRVGDGVGDLDDHAGVGPPGDHRRDRRRRRPRPRCRRRRRRRSAAGASARRRRRSRRGRRGGRGPTRRSSRRERSCRPGRRPRSSCCRSSSGPASRAPRSPARRTRPRSRSCRRCRGGRSSPGSDPWA